MPPADMPDLQATMDESPTSAPKHRPRPLQSVVLSGADILSLFDLDPRSAEEKYLALFHRLVRYFDWKRQREPEDLAQEALRRGLARLQQGQKITVSNPEGYFFGVARNILRENWTTRPQEQLQENYESVNAVVYRNLYSEEARVLLSQCIRDLSSEELAMLIAYTEGLGEAWARKAGLKPTTVRSRVHRIRKRLEMLAAAKQSGQGASPGSSTPGKTNRVKGEA